MLRLQESWPCFIDFSSLHPLQAKTHFSSAVRKSQANWKTVHDVQEKCLMEAKEKERIVKDEKLKTRQKRRKTEKFVFDTESKEEGMRWKKWYRLLWLQLVKKNLRKKFLWKILSLKLNVFHHFQINLWLKILTNACVFKTVRSARHTIINSP